MPSNPPNPMSNDTNTTQERQTPTPDQIRSAYEYAHTFCSLTSNNTGEVPTRFHLAVMASHAEQKERELAAVTKERDEAQHQEQMHRSSVAKARNEAREALMKIVGFCWKDFE